MGLSKKSSIESGHHALGHEAGEGELDPMFEWMASPDGQAFEQARQLAEEALGEVRVDSGARRLLWPDGASLTIEQSVRRIGRMAETGENIAPERIEEEVCAWLEGGYAPEDLTPEQLEELDEQVELWLEDHREENDGSDD